MKFLDYLKSKGNKPAKKVSIEKIEQCHNCRQLQGTVCQINKQVMKPNDSCSRWS